MLNKILNLFGYHAVIVRLNEADGIFECADWWVNTVRFESENDDKHFTLVLNLFNRRRK